MKRLPSYKLKLQVELGTLEPELAIVIVQIKAEDA